MKRWPSCFFHFSDVCLGFCSGFLGGSSGFSLRMLLVGFSGDFF